MPTTVSHAAPGMPEGEIGKNAVMSTKDPSAASGLATPIDREALRVRYRAERDKRLRPEGNDQYIEPRGRFAHFRADPYAEPADRKPLFDEAAVVVVETAVVADALLVTV